MLLNSIRLSLAALALLPATGLAQEAVALKQAKLNIEHNATDLDTGFQGFLDGEGWQSLIVTGPAGPVLRFEGLGTLGTLGLTELFFETTEPLNAEVPLDRVLANLPEGEYRFEGSMIDGGTTSGVAMLTHAIPAGPDLMSPAEGAVVSAVGTKVSWGKVTETTTGAPATIIAYQLVIEKAVDPHPHMIGKFGLNIYLPPSVTELELPTGFLEPGSAYKWEVLAIEESGNQTLSSGAFSTQ